MATPTTLDDFAGQARAAWAAAQTGARAALAGAVTAVAATRAALAQANDALAAARAALAAKRAELDASTVPADQVVLIGQVAALRAQARSREAAVRDAGDAVARAEARNAAAARFAAAANAGVAAAGAEQGALEAEHGRLQALRDAATDPPLDTLPGEVDAALAGEPYTSAKARVDGGLPPELVSAARAGHAAEGAAVKAYRASQEAAEDLLAAALALAEGHDAAVDGARVKLDRAERRLRDWVERGRERFTRAQAQLQALVDGGPLLTPAEAAALGAGAGDAGPAPDPGADPGAGADPADDPGAAPVADLEDADAGDAEAAEAAEAAEPAADAGDAEAGDTTPGAAAAALRATLAGARGTLRTADIELDGARLAALAPDPLADVSAAPGVVSATSARTSAATALQNAENAYTPAVANDYTTLVANVSDAAWARVLAFFEAEAALNELGAVNPATLAGNLAQAEEELAEALWNRHAGALSAAFLAEQAAFRQALYERARDSRPGRLLGAVRGDA
jgi:hypothetical protein